MDDIEHEQTIIKFWRQLFAGHMMGFRPIKKTRKICNE